MIRVKTQKKMNKINKIKKLFKKQIKNKLIIKQMAKIVYNKI